MGKQRESVLLLSEIVIFRIHKCIDSVYIQYIKLLKVRSFYHGPEIEMQIKLVALSMLSGLKRDDI